MFTFLNSIILAGLAAVAIPVLIHLFTRQKQKVVPFSSLRFLKELQQQKIRRLKIRQILLLLLRTLFVLLVVLAFSRPALKGDNASSIDSGAQLTAVIILDNSMSMGLESRGMRLLDLARRRAYEVAELLRPGDELFLVHPLSPAGDALTGPRYTPEASRELIDNTVLSHAATDYAHAMQIAADLMARSMNVNKEVYLISDQQRNGLVEMANDSLVRFQENVRILSLPVGVQQFDNLSVEEVTFGNQIFEVGKTMEIIARIRNNGSARVEERLVHLFANGKRQAQAVLNIGTDAAQTVTFNFIPDSTGFQSGYLLLEDDDLLADNRRYFSFNIAAELKVLLVGQRAEDTRYLKLALTPQKKVNTNIIVSDILYSDINKHNLADNQVVMLSNVPRLNAMSVQAVQRFVADGGGLFIIPGSDIDLRNYNDGLHKKLDLPALAEIFAAQEDAYLTFGNIDLSHPIFNTVFSENKEIGSPYIHRAIKVTSAKPVDEIIEYNNGMPFLFETRFQKGRILYLTTGLTPDWSDLRVRGIFVPLINRSVTYLSPLATESVAGLIIGDEIVHTPALSDSDGELLLIKPDASEVKLAPEIHNSNLRVRFKGTDVPGVYKLLFNGRVLMQWAVNPDPVESDIEPVSTDDIRAHFGLSEVTEVTKERNLQPVLEETRFGIELWHTLLLLALLVLLVETLLLKESRLAEAK